MIQRILLSWIMFGWGMQCAQAEPILLQSALTRIADSRDLSAAQSGILAEVLVQEGQIVVQGEPIARVDDAILKVKRQRATVEAAIAAEQAENDVAIRLARKTQELAHTEYERAVALNRGIPDTVSQRELNVLRLTRDKAMLEIENSEHEQAVARLTQQLRQADLEVADVDMQRCLIAAPMSGMVVHVERQIGEWVDAGGLVARVVRIDRIRAEGFVTADEAGRGLRDLPATLELTLPANQKREFTGQVVFVSPEANPVDGRVRVWADFENTESLLRPGLPATVHVHVTATSLPIQATPRTRK